MKLYRKIITFFMTFAIVVSLSVPAFAFNIGEVIQGVGTVVSLIDMAHGIYKEYYNADGSAKPGASAGWTNGGTFGGGAGRKDYTDYVNGVQTEYGGVEFCNDGTVLLKNWSVVSALVDGVDVSPDVTFNSGNNHVSYHRTNSKNYPCYISYRLSFQLSLPALVKLSCSSWPFLSSTGISFDNVYFHTKGNASVATGVDANGLANCWYLGAKIASPITWSSVGVDSYCFDFRLVIPPAACGVGSTVVYNFDFPDVFVSSSGLSNGVTLITNDTRTGSLSGNFGYTGPDGTMITAENIKIVNETTNTLFNPVTNTTTNFKDWTYDYSTRTYNVTLDTGTKQTITYGDENVTIKEGDTIYNIYYVTPDTPPTPPVTCKHDYIPAVTTAATCIAPGVKAYTCSKCKDSYIEKIPATGHSWTVKETVNTTYDAAGVLLKQGYTIFKCSICGEEYKDSSGTGPPGGGGGGESGKPSIWDKLGSLLGSAANGFITVLKTAVIKILDALVAMFDAINTKLASVTTAIFGLFDRIPQLFGGFTGFLSAVFPFFPPEVFDILTLSILILAAATLIKFFLKR